MGSRASGGILKTLQDAREPYKKVINKNSGVFLCLGRIPSLKSLFYCPDSFIKPFRTHEKPFRKRSVLLFILGQETSLIKAFFAITALLKIPSRTRENPFKKRSNLFQVPFYVSTKRSASRPIFKQPSFRCKPLRFQAPSAMPCQLGSPQCTPSSPDNKPDEYQARNIEPSALLSKTLKPLLSTVLRYYTTIASGAKHCLSALYLIQSKSCFSLF